MTNSYRITFHRLAQGGCLLAVAVATMAVAGCSRGDAAATQPGATTQPAARPGEAGGAGAGPKPVAVKLGAVRTDSMDRTIELVGTLYGDEEATISAKVPGRIRRALVDVADRVKPGQPLAEIDPEDYRLAVEQRQMAVLETLSRLGLTRLPDESFDVAQVPTVQKARSEADNARARMERSAQLFKQTPPLISEQEYRDLQTAYAVAQQELNVALLEARSLVAQARSRQSELEAARQRLADATIQAPQPAESGSSAADGPKFAITQRMVSAGEYVREGTAMYRLVIDDPVKFRGAAPERFVGQVRAGQAVRLRIEGSNEDFPGTVSRVNPSIETATRTFMVEAILANAHHRLRPGAFARASILVEQDPQVMFVPRQAIVTFAGTDRVFTVAQGKAVEHRIRIRSERHGWVALAQPIDGAKEVVVEGAAGLAHGSTVTLKSAETRPSSAPNVAGP